MKISITIIGLLLSVYVSSQISYETYCLYDNTTGIMHAPGTINSDTLRSKNGAIFPTTGTYRALTIAVNIIYDETPLADPKKDPGGAWDTTSIEGINNNPPDYLLNFFDVNNVIPYNGCVTRLYAESSFNQLILLSDYMVVNIKQSRITPNNYGGAFYPSNLMDAVVNYINLNGGLNTLYNHDSISDYDFCTLSKNGKEKLNTPDNKIDIINFLLRNTTKKYGGVPEDQGYSYLGPGVNLKIGGSYYGYNTDISSYISGTYQCVGNKDITEWKKNIFTHEYAHFFLGGNEFHTSGGNHQGDTKNNTFIGKQWGYGLFNGGLLSCNGYERWRLGWNGSANNAYPLAANNENSDLITKFTGEKTFILRDFVTYGDAIRIKLPYKDSEYALNQYIWLENHQSGKNGKFDEFMYSDSNTCRFVDKAGIYAYYQVGKDIIESTDYYQVFPSDIEKDNLRIISAEGNYNVNYLGQYDDCLVWAGEGGRPRFEYNTPNTFGGVNCETEVWRTDYSYSSLIFTTNRNDHLLMGSKRKNNINYDNLPWLGDGNFSAFIPTSSGSVINISTNPSAVNTTTYYSVRYTTEYSATMYQTNTNKNTRKLYLSGLSIKMIDPYPLDTVMKAYTVKIRWDDYDVKQDVNWTGDIVLKEQLNLLQGKTLTLEQNKTPNQIEKDPISNYFSKTTFLTCESNSIFNMAANSSASLKEKSSLVLNSSSTLTIQDGGSITVESGSTLQIKSGANLNILGSGKIVIKSGAYICVESGANINLQDYNSLIILEEGANYGANPLLFTNASCSSLINKTGNGSTVDFNQDVYIQNQTISSSRYIGGKDIYVGYDVDPNQIAGDVIISNGANVIFDCKTITLDHGFECVGGSTFEVKNH